MLIILLLQQFSISTLNDKLKTYTFMTNQKTRITLQDPNIYLNQNDSSSKFSIKKTKANDDENEKEWYYVHFSSENLPEIKKYVQLNRRNQMLKNTYLLHLSKEQLRLISNISVVKLLGPEDKVILMGGPIQETNYLIVSVAPGFELPVNSDLYRIESLWYQNMYIVEIEQNSLDEKKFNEKKLKAIEQLTSYKFVESVSTYKKPNLKNNVGTGYTQRNSRNFTKGGNTNIETIDRYFKDNHITGNGEIITVIDTLIDVFHTMFFDEKFFTEEKVPIIFNERLLNHRKFVYYGYPPNNLSIWEDEITENEHGTHVSGTLAGQSECTETQVERLGANLFDGNAPDAKILYAGQLNKVSAQLQFDLMYVFQSRISTNSWGVDGFNDAINYVYGELSHFYSSSIFIYAAGNEYESIGNFSVCDPGGSKNVLTVGALGSFYDSPHIYYLRSLNDQEVSFTAYAMIDPEPYLMGTIGTEELKSDIVIIDAGAAGNNCSVIDQPQITLLFLTSVNQLFWMYGCDIQKSKGILYTENYQGIEYMINAGNLVYMQDITPYNKTFNVTHAPYSSTGPANKGILKPDVMAPGTRIISSKSLAHSNETHGCMVTDGKSLTFMQGTSMATPNAAGAAALVRQYFRDNWTVGSADLDGPTVRALLINSCIQQPEGSRTPNTEFGHGQIDLSTVLPIDHNFGVQITHQVKAEQPSITEYSQVVATINVKSNKVKFQVTLSYLDPLINPTTYIPLTRDLDLIVKSKSGKVFRGDHLPNNDTQHFSTNEKVIINPDEIEPGEYTIHIYSLDFLDEPVNETDKIQNFSVVATGDIDDSYIDFTEAQNCGCDQCDPVHPLHCLCDNFTIGEICQASVDQLVDIKTSYTVHPLELQYVRVNSDFPIKTLGLFAVGKAANMVEAFADTECHMSIGEYPVRLNVGEDTHLTTDFDFNTTSICVALFNNNYQETHFTLERDFVSPPDPASETGHKKGLSKGAIAGIVIGCVCGAALIIGLTIGLVRRKNGSIRDF